LTSCQRQLTERNTYTCPDCEDEFCKKHKKHEDHDQTKVNCHKRNCLFTFPKCETNERKCNFKGKCLGYSYCDEHRQHPHREHKENTDSIKNVPSSASTDRTTRQSSVASTNRTTRQSEKNTKTCCEIDCIEIGKYFCKTCDDPYFVFCGDHKDHNEHIDCKPKEIIITSEFQNLFQLVERKPLNVAKFASQETNIFGDNIDIVMMRSPSNVLDTPEESIAKTKALFLDKCITLTMVDYDLTDMVMKHLTTEFMVKVPKKHLEKTLPSVNFSILDFLHTLYDETNENIKASYKRIVSELSKNKIFKKKSMDKENEENKYLRMFREKFNKILKKIGDMIIRDCFAIQNNNYPNTEHPVFGVYGFTDEVIKENGSYYDGSRRLEIKDGDKIVNYIPFNDQYNLMSVIDFITASFNIREILLLNISLMMQDENSSHTFIRIETVDIPPRPAERYLDTIFLHNVFALRFNVKEGKDGKMTEVQNFRTSATFQELCTKFLNYTYTSADLKDIIRSVFQRNFRLTNEDEDSKKRRKKKKLYTFDLTNIEDDKLNEKEKKKLSKILDKASEEDHLKYNDKEDLITKFSECWDESDKNIVLNASIELEKIKKNMEVKKEQANKTNSTMRVVHNEKAQALELKLRSTERDILTNYAAKKNVSKIVLATSLEKKNKKLEGLTKVVKIVNNEIKNLKKHLTTSKNELDNFCESGTFNIDEMKEKLDESIEKTIQKVNELKNALHVESTDEESDEDDESKSSENNDGENLIDALNAEENSVHDEEVENNILNEDENNIDNEVENNILNEDENNIDNEVENNILNEDENNIDNEDELVDKKKKRRKRKRKQEK
jgi:hypothetical protein